MTEPLSPEQQIKALMAGYVLDDLTPEEAKLFEQLLRENPNLMAEVKRLQETLDVLPYALPEVEPPPRLREAILEATSLEIKRNPLRQLSRLPWRKVLASLAALLAIALGVDNYLLRQELRTASLDNERLRQELQAVQSQNNVVNVLQQPYTRVYSLLGTDQATTASGSIVVNFNQQKAVIVFQNLPTPSQEKIYRLWAIIDDKKIACADFRTTGEGKVLEEFSLPAAACSSAKSTLAVTLEPLPSPPQPIGPAVMVERVSS
jgi:anti-sigma-K factor RskA